MYQKVKVILKSKCVNFKTEGFHFSIIKPVSNFQGCQVIFPKEKQKENF